MDETNATPGDEGASIQDRLERMFSADSAPEKTETTQPERTEPAQTAEVEVVEPDNGGKEQAPGPQITTLDLAKYLGVDETMIDLDEDGTVKFKTKVGGVEGSAKAGDVLKSYQLEGHVNKRSMEQAERERAWQAHVQQSEQQFNQRVQYAEQLANTAGNELMREFQSIDWNALRQADPGSYAALKEDFRERGQRLQGILQQAAQHQQQNQQKFSQQVEARKSEEAQRLVNLVPEWKNPETFSKDSAEIWKLASERGIPADMLKALSEGPLVNAGVISMMRDAVEFQRLKASKPEIENKVRLAPKLVKPGQAVQQTEGQKLQSLRADIRKSGGKGDSLEAFLVASGKV